MIQYWHTYFPPYGRAVLSRALFFFRWNFLSRVKIKNTIHLSFFPFGGLGVILLKYTTIALAKLYNID